MHTTVSEPHKLVYAYIGQRIRGRRKLLRLSQSELADLMGFSYQQMQKYETGASHVSAGKLLLFAKILNVPPGYFYDGFTLEKSIGKRIETSVIQKTRTEPLRILLVEPNPADVILFRKALAVCREQVDMHALHEAEAAMDFLQNHETKFGRKAPDIVILDIALPKGGGMELLRSIKKHPRTQELPIIVLTNSVNVKDMTESYRQGAAGFIQKSVNIEEYLETLESVVTYWAKTVALPV